MRGGLFRRVVGGFAVLQVSAFLLIAAGELIPDDRVLDQVARAVEKGDMTRVDTPRQSTGGIADRFGECVTATVGVGASGRSWFETMALSPNLGSCPRMIDQLDRRSAGEEVRGVPKVRYWNGLSSVARPVVAAVGVAGARLVAALVLAASFVWLAASVARATDRFVAAALAVPLAALTDPRGLVGVFHHPFMVAVGLAGAAVLVRRAADDGRPAELALLAFGVAGIYSFFDLMNFVVGMWAASSMLVGLAVPRQADLRRRWRSVAGVFIAWPVGYVSMWVGKWFWAAVASSPAAVSDEILSQVEFRLNGSSQFATGDFGAGLRANLSFWRAQELGTLVILAFAAVGGVALVFALVRGANSRALAAVLAPAFVVVPWYLATNNHNEIHYWFEYRSLGLVFAVGFAVAVSAARGRFRDIHR